MSANHWMQDFHNFVQKKSERLAQCELEKGDLEATMLLIGSKALTLFPDDVRDGDQVPDTLIRLLEELSERRAKEKKNELSNV